MMISTLLKPSVTVNGKKYKIINQIGEGAFGYVYHVKSTHASDKAESYALKKMICQTSEQMAEAKREMDVMLKVHHPNILPLLNFSYLRNKKGQDEVYMLMPLYHTSVQAMIDDCFGYPHCAFADGLDVVKILRHSAEGLLALHKAGFRHGDFKPANILINEAYDAVITDFGSASPLETNVTSRSQALEVQDFALSHSTASYRAPELFDTPNTCVIDGKADVWAFGCAMYCLFYSRTPFETAVEGLSTLSIMSSHFSFPDDNIWPEDYIELVRHCLTVDTSQRLDATTLQQRLKRLTGPPLELQKVPEGRKGGNISPVLLSEDTSCSDSAQQSPPSSLRAMPSESLTSTSCTTTTVSSSEALTTPAPLPAPVGTPSSQRMSMNLFANFDASAAALLAAAASHQRSDIDLLEEHMVRTSSLDSFASPRSSALFRSSNGPPPELSAQNTPDKPADNSADSITNNVDGRQQPPQLQPQFSSTATATTSTATLVAVSHSSSSTNTVLVDKDGGVPTLLSSAGSSSIGLDLHVHSQSQQALLLLQTSEASSPIERLNRSGFSDNVVHVEMPSPLPGSMSTDAASSSAATGDFATAVATKTAAFDDVIDEEDDDEFGDFTAANAAAAAERRSSVNQGNIGGNNHSPAIDHTSTYGANDQVSSPVPSLLPPSATASSSSTSASDATTVSTADQAPAAMYSAVDLLQVILAEAQEDSHSAAILHQGRAFMMRMGGFPVKKSVRKEVWLVVTQSGLLLRKDRTPQSKVHEVVSFHQPLSLTPSDTLAVGLHGLLITGSSPQTLSTLGSSSQPSTPHTPSPPLSSEGGGTAGGLEDDWVCIDLPTSSLAITTTSTHTPDPPTAATATTHASTSQEHNNTNAHTNSKCSRQRWRSRFLPCRIEVAFVDKDSLHTWMDLVDQQCELCRGLV